MSAGQLSGTKKTTKVKILITGSLGFLGKNLLLGLDHSFECVALTRSINQERLQFVHKVDKHVELEVCDLLDVSALQRLKEKHGKFDACVYLAANGDPAYSVENPKIDLESNALALVNLLSNVDIGHLIFFSSGAVYDGLAGDVDTNSNINPILPYSISKYASEQYIKFFKKEGRLEKYTIVRFFGAFGPYEPARKIYGKLLRTFGVEKKLEFTIRGDGKNLIDAMYIDDTIEAIRLILKSEEKESVTIDLGSGSPVSIADLAMTAGSICGVEPIISYEGTVPECIMFKTVDTRASDRFKFYPKVPLRIGLAKYLQWIKDNNS